MRRREKFTTIKSFSVRFNLDKPVQKAAYEHLESMDRKKYKSYNNVVAVALNEFFDREDLRSIDPYFDTAEREQIFTDRICDSVEKSLIKSMPVFMAKYITDGTTLDMVRNTAQRYFIVRSDNDSSQNMQIEDQVHF